ncbi:metal tolerance protein 7-like isoform X2 [Limulus polyphemus]|uniref:Metal tolerance protein 7-like isoform X2 n=1 Tax=Limulus polyphemus TaxID=6850 RepID=A0ABM1TGD0_LIMPO|nr:metal tolerance protein 7-like isoform X2 [Limulus polyphemus]
MEFYRRRSSDASTHKEENIERIMEINPERGNAQIESSSWRLPLQWFTDKKQIQGAGDKKQSRRLRRYYKIQNDLISSYEELHIQSSRTNLSNNHDADFSKQRRNDMIISKLSFLCNLALLIAKTTTAVFSGSLAVISSVVDSVMDLAAGILLWWSNRATKNKDIYRYPQGRTKLVPVSVIILSVVMSVASIQMIRESVEKILYYMDHAGDVEFGLISIITLSFSVGMKALLFAVSFRIKTVSAQALSQDHRNDVLSNSVALACGFVGSKYWKYADPLGAILIGMYIIINWGITGWMQIKLLTGYTAKPEFLKKVTWLALNHDSTIRQIDTVRAFHFGTNLLVEVDIVLAEDTPLKDAHDVGESLQQKLEALPEVERAFVHLDYETQHAPHIEHKRV